ncbi:MAG: folate-binding protein [Streptosporangiales bacterium]|nr:folate-binding protein [Streptosporangiales bacterium]
MESQLLHIPGAVAAEAPDDGVAAHYGEPYHEQRALAEDAGLVDRSNRGVVRVAGPDRLTWLHSLLTQHLERLEPQAAAESLVLSPHGHVEHHLSLVDDGEAVWAHVEPGTAGELVSFLESMRFLMRVELADVTGEYAVLSVCGPGTDKALAEAALPDDAPARRDPYGTDLFVPRARLAEVADRIREAGARPAGMWAYEALRIAAYRPRLGLDTDHRTIPHEVGWLETAVHLDKGCYRGQETVARVYNLGRPPRRLVFLHLDGSVDRLPGHGDPVEQDGRQVGFVGSAARHHELGPIALALVKRNVPTDATLLAGGVAAAQEVVVSPDTGAHVKIDVRRR